MNVLVATTSTTSPKVIVAATPRDDLRPMRQGTTIPPRTQDTDAMSVTVLAWELGMSPTALVARLRADGEYVKGVRSKVPAPVVRKYLMRLSPDGMAQVEEALASAPRVVPELAALLAR